MMKARPEPLPDDVHAELVKLLYTALPQVTACTVIGGGVIAWRANAGGLPWAVAAAALVVSLCRIGVILAFPKTGAAMSRRQAVRWEALMAAAPSRSASSSQR